MSDTPNTSPSPENTSNASEVPKKPLDLHALGNEMGTSMDKLHDELHQNVATGIPPEVKKDENRIQSSVSAEMNTQTTTTANGYNSGGTIARSAWTLQKLGNLVAAVLFAFALITTFLTFNFNANPTMFGDNPQVGGGILLFLINLFYGGFTLVILGLLVGSALTFLLGKKEQKANNQALLISLVITPILLLVGGAGWFLMPKFVYIQQETPAEQTDGKTAYTTPQMTVLVRDEETGTLRRLTNPTGLVAPLEMQFDSTLNIPQETEFYRIISFAWDVNGDGLFDKEEGTEGITSYTYKEKGTFDVALKVKKQVLRSTETAKQGDLIEEIYGPGASKGGYTLAITKVKPALTIETTPTTLKGPAPLEIEFDASKTIGESRITKIQWDFEGDNQFDADGAKQKHTFEKPGFYQVLVQATDENGLIASKKIEVDVGKPNVPTAVIGANQFVGTAPLKVDFKAGDSTTPDGRITSYIWNFGDDSPEEKGEKVSHTYMIPGKYKVKLSLETDIKTQAEATEDVTVTAPKGAPTARIQAKIGDTFVEEGSKITGNVPLEVKFDSSFSTDPENDIVSREWDFNGDKKFDEAGMTATYQYKTAGKYLVTLRVTDSSKNISESTVNVDVAAEELSAVISADPVQGEAPLWVAFDGSSSNYAKGQIISYKWDFGDGTPPQETGATISHQFQAPGTYTVSLVVRTADGKSAQAKQLVAVLQEALVPIFNMAPSFGPAPLIVDFDGRASKGKIISYRWDFGDGGKATGARTNYTFQKAGTYTITLTVQDVNGNAQKSTRTITVTAQ